MAERAAADDAPLSVIAACTGACLQDDDNLFGADVADDNEDANIWAARQAERGLEKIKLSSKKTLLPGKQQR